MGTAQLIVAALGLFATGSLGTQAADNGLNDSLLWGPYKSNLYLGIRPKLPHALWTGLMWAKTDTYADVQNLLRYTCEQSDDLHGYGWDEYDARRGGVQTIHDGGNMIDMTTSFVKIPGGSHGGSWAARIKGTLREGAPADTKTMIFYYIAQEGLGELAVEGGDESGFAGDVTFRGSSAALGEYSLVIGEGSGRHPSSSHAASSRRKGDRTVVRSINLPPEQQWQAVPAVFNELRTSLRWVQDNFETGNLPPPWQTYRLEPQAGSGNVQVVQKVFEGDFEFDVLFSSGSADTLTSADVTRELEAASSAFAQRFSAVFELKPPYTAAKYQRFARTLFSSLLGGVGYFSGEQVVDRSYADEYEEDEEGFWEGTAAARARGGQKLEGPYELLTAVPSRSFFPRGFLWDEGFHLALVAEWDADLAEEIVRSWYGTMDEDGWIAREQILGDEARAKVPPEFQVQYPHYANPPTLFLTVEELMGRESYGGGGKGGEGGRFLDDMYPLLRRQYDWFRRTQRGEVRAYDRTAYSSREAYRWKGRTETHCLTSGLDDYPRPQPSPAELHVDLLAWVGVMARSLQRVATTLGYVEDAEEYAQQLNAIERNLVDLHWSESEGCFCDATVDEDDEHRLVCHRGYVSIFPFLLGLMRADDERVGRILDLVGDEGELFSPYGLRSLSKRDDKYGTGENYWRGPVWMPMNYLALVELHKLATQKGPFRERARGMYGRLRRNLVDTVFASWEETGIAWEQYDAETGRGQRNRQFTGWTSLVVKMMAMEDLEGHVRDEL